MLQTVVHAINKLFKLMKITELWTHMWQTGCLC